MSGSRSARLGLLAGLAVVLNAAGAPAVQAQEQTDTQRLYAFVTNRYLAEFDYLRDGILTAEMLNLCGDQLRAGALADVLIARELTLKRELIQATDAADLPDAPAPGPDRRALVSTWIAGFEALDATARHLMVQAIATDPVAPALCTSANTRADALVSPAQ